MPCTVTSRKVRLSHAEETVVLSLGRTVSMRTDWIFQDDCLPSPSVMRVRSVCTPSPLTVTLTGPAPGTVAERASSTSSHSICATPLPPASVPATLTSTDGVVTQPAGTVVVSTGPAESTCTMWGVHGATRCPRCRRRCVRSVCVPFAVMSKRVADVGRGRAVAVELVDHVGDAGLVADVGAGKRDGGLVVLPARRDGRGVDRGRGVDVDEVLVPAGPVAGAGLLGAVQEAVRAGAGDGRGGADLRGAAVDLPLEALHAGALQVHVDGRVDPAGGNGRVIGGRGGRRQRCR